MDHAFVSAKIKYVACYVWFCISPLVCVLRAMWCAYEIVKVKGIFLQLLRMFYCFSPLFKSWASSLVLFVIVHVPLFYCFIALLFHCSIILSFCHSIIPLFCCFVITSFFCFFTPFYLFIILLLYHFVIIFMFCCLLCLSLS